MEETTDGLNMDNPDTRVRILTFNVFAGSPVPVQWLFGGTSSLQNSKRLRAQLQAVRAVDADVICLQELYCDNVLASYMLEFGDEYQFAVQRDRKLLGVAAGEIIILLLASIAWPLARAAMGDVSSCLSLFISGVLTACLWLTLRVTMRHSALLAFFNGRVKGFMATMWKRSVFELSDDETLYFTEQRGDIENLFRPRAFQLLHLKHRMTNYLYTFIHIHTNALGQSYLRARQVHEAVNAAGVANRGSLVTLLGDFNDGEDSEPVRTAVKCGFVDAFRAHGTGHGHTWVHSNSMTRGYMRVPNLRCDYIFYRRNHPHASAIKNNDTTTLSNARCDVVLDDNPTSDHFGVLLDFGPLWDTHPRSLYAKNVPAPRG